MITELIKDDIKLFDDSFPGAFDWSRIEWETTNDNEAYYSFVNNKIVLCPKALENDYIRFHEMGHAIHHKLFNFKRFHFKTAELDVCCNMYWGIPNCKRNYLESFADAFSDTMLRLKTPKCAMFSHNKKVIQLLNGVRM